MDGELTGWDIWMKDERLQMGVDKESCTINEFVIFQQEVLHNSEKNL